MVKSQIQAEINADLAAVWALVTDVSRADWRSDVKKIEVVQARRQPLPLRPSIRISDMNLPWKTSTYPAGGRGALQE